MKKHSIAKLVIILLSTVVTFASNVRAEEANEASLDDGIVCLAWVPCNDDGTVFAEIPQDSVCYPQYARQCAILKAPVETCEDSSSKINQLEKKIRKLSQKLKSHRSRR